MLRILSLICAALLFACSSAPENVGASPADPAVPGGSARTAMNAVCPMQGDEAVDESVTTEFHGQTVAFCCNRCKDAWEGLTDEERAAKLDAIKQ